MELGSLAFSSAAGLLIFSVSSYKGAGLQDDFGTGERKLGKEVKMPQVHSLLSLSSLSSVNAPWIIECLWLILRVLGNLFLTKFASVLTSFMMEHIFWGLYSDIPEELLPRVIILNDPLYPTTNLTFFIEITSL